VPELERDGIAERSWPERARNESRRQQVLQGATQCFCRHGFHNASMAEIAKSAGMSVGHIYHYFESKEAIIIAIVEGQQEEVLALLDQVERSSVPLADALLHEAARGVDGCMDVASTALMLEVLAEAARNPKVAEVVQASDAVLRRRMREVLARAMGHADPADVPAIEDRVESLFTLFQGIPVRAIRNPALDRERMVRIVRETIRWILHEPA